MFDRELFLTLCEKYDVELSATAKRPMIREGNETHEITAEDVRRIVMPHHVYFEYSSNRVDTNTDSSSFYLPDDFAIAC